MKLMRPLAQYLVYHKHSINSYYYFSDYNIIVSRLYLQY